MQQQQLQPPQQSSSVDWAASNPPQGCKCLFSLQENILSFSCHLWAATVSKCSFIRSALASRKREEIKASHQPNHISCVPSTCTNRTFSGAITPLPQPSTSCVFPVLSQWRHLASPCQPNICGTNSSRSCSSCCRGSIFDADTR